jgi:hypothetical protein
LSARPARTTACRLLDHRAGRPGSTQSRPSSSDFGMSRSGRPFQAARQPSRAAALRGASRPQVRGIATAMPCSDDLILAGRDVWCGDNDETEPVEPAQRFVRHCRGDCVGDLWRIGFRISREGPGPADGLDAIGYNTFVGTQGRERGGASSAEAAVRRDTDNADGNCGRSCPRLIDSASGLAVATSAGAAAAERLLASESVQPSVLFRVGPVSIDGGQPEASSGAAGHSALLRTRRPNPFKLSTAASTPEPWLPSLP